MKLKRGGNNVYQKVESELQKYCFLCFNERFYLFRDDMHFYLDIV